MNFISKNPRNGNLFASHNEDTGEALVNKLNIAKNTFATWKNTDINQRADLLLRFANLLINHKLELAQLIHDEAGKSMLEANNEIEKCALCCEYYAYQAHEMLQAEDVFTNASQSYIMYRPLGAILAIMPWNFPFWQVIRFAAPALMSGNVCLLKPAPQSASCGLKIQELMKTAGFENGIFQTILVANENIESVISNDIVQAVTFTGSAKAGSVVASLAGKYLKKSVLELGGSDPYMVFSDCNLDTAIKMALQSRLINNGQSCIAAKRFIVEANVYEKFIQGLIIELDKQKKSSEYEVTPLIAEENAKHLILQAEQAVAQGAILKYGRLQNDGAFVEPIVLGDIKPDFDILKEEFFGPVFLISSFESLDEALYQANNTPFGLGASIWTANEQVQQHLIQNLDCGMVFVNGIVFSDPRLPFGGVKQSGYGRELYALGLREFCNAKTVWIKN